MEVAWTWNVDGMMDGLAHGRGCGLVAGHFARLMGGRTGDWLEMA